MVNSNANTEIYDKIVNRSAMIRLYERRVNGKVELVLNDHVVNVGGLIKTADTSPLGIKRLYKELSEQRKNTYTKVKSVSEKGLLDLAVDQLSFTAQTIDATMGKIWNTQKPVRKVAENIVLTRPLIGDSTLSRGWLGISNAEKVRLESEIRKGIATGRTPE